MYNWFSDMDYHEFVRELFFNCLLLIGLLLVGWLVSRYFETFSQVINNLLKKNFIFAVFFDASRKVST